METKASPLHEFAVTRLEKSSKGTKGADMEPFDPRRVRYYVRATSQTEAITEMAVRYPEEKKFAAMLITENVKPFNFNKAA